jgi:hypothetical protein
MPAPSKWSFFFRLPHKKTLCISYVLHMCHMSGTSHPSWSDHLNNYLRAVKLWSPLIMQFSQSSCYLLPLRTKYVPQHMLLNTLGLCSLLSVRDHVSGPHETKSKIYVFEYTYILLENQGLMCHWNGTNNMIITH